MTKLRLVLLLFAFLATVSLSIPIRSAVTPSVRSSPSSYGLSKAGLTATQFWSDPYLNVLDSSGGDTGWSPVWRQRDNVWRWDQFWTSAYRHSNTIESTSYGTATRLKGDTQSQVSTAPAAFYQYRKLTTGFAGSYKLHLSFWIREDSSTTASTVDNWEIMILDSKHTSWQSPLWQRSYYDSTNLEHGVFGHRSFDIALSDPEVYLLVGHWDSWQADWQQGHTKCFIEISGHNNFDLLSKAPGFDYAAYGGDQNCILATGKVEFAAHAYGYGIASSYGQLYRKFDTLTDSGWTLIRYDFQHAYRLYVPWGGAGADIRLTIWDGDSLVWQAQISAQMIQVAGDIAVNEDPSEYWLDGPSLVANHQYKIAVLVSCNAAAGWYFLPGEAHVGSVTSPASQRGWTLCQLFEVYWEP